MINSEIHAELTQGHRGITDEERFFVKQFNAYVSPSKQTFKEVVEPNTTNPMENLRVVEQPGVTINMSKVDYEIMCKKLNDCYEDEYLRTLNPQAFDLWMAYQTYVQLMK